jgi:hypothetical protein
MAKTHARRSRAMDPLCDHLPEQDITSASIPDYTGIIPRIAAMKELDILDPSFTSIWTTHPELHDSQS